MAFAGLGAGIMSEYLASNLARDKQVHEYMYGTNCSRGNAQDCLLDREIFNADASDASLMRTLGIGLGVGGAVIGVGGLVLAIIAKPEVARPADETTPDKQAAAKRIFQSVGCGPFGDVGLSCAGKF